MTASKAKARSRAGTLPEPGAVTARPFERPWAGSLAPLIEYLGALARAEAGAGRLLPWVPVAFGAGIALYFAAGHEPVDWVTVVTALGLASAAVAARHRPALFPALALVAALAAGFATATMRAARLAHPVLAQPVSAATLSGFVETRELRERTDRFVLRVTKMEAARGIALERVRLSVRKGAAPDVGSFVELKARLSPPTQPLRPGSYDFARDLYFQGIGGTGFVLGRITTAAAPEGGGPWLRYAATLQDIRDAADARIGAVVKGDARAIATALITGRRDALTAPVNDALFISGLGHVLSISGYHMALVAGVVFFAARALFALSGRLAGSRPIKKWAALVALAAAAFYLALSGAEVATQRSFLMTALVLVGVMVDRRAITFRTLAIAALAVLALAPESLVHPSFQMSFAATLGLVALIEQGMPKLFSLPREGPASALAAWGGREVTALTMASLIAGFATMPYAAFHFHRITPYGVIANLAAMPVVSGWVMPAGILGLVAMPFGLDGVFWRLMEWGIDWMVAVSRFVAGLPGAVGRVPAFGIGPLIAMTFGMIVMGLLKSALRWSGAAVIALGAVWAALATQPDILVAANGQAAAVRGADGRLRVMLNGKDTFALREWLAGDGDTRTVADPSLTEGVRCDELGCVAPVREGGTVALARTVAALADDCARAAVAIMAWQAPSDCAAHVVSAAETDRSAAALWRTAHGFRLETAAAGYDRPWIRRPEIRRPDTAPEAKPSNRTVEAKPPNGSAAARPPNRHSAVPDATPDEASLDPD
ncbi:MAG: ComEC family competence protein [Xanthobacteraceae bacterium]|nr:MAG: ComEC family competence protein [Xanthobacteraceae bacterium]